MAGPDARGDGVSFFHPGPSGATLLAALLPAAALLFAVCVICVLTGQEFEVFASDPAYQFGFPFYGGLLSNLGVLLWGAAGAVALFASVVLRPMPEARGAARFLFWGAMLSFLLMIDDALALHDEVFPQALPVDEVPFLILYMVLTGVFLVVFRRQVLAGPWPVLAVALVNFVGSYVFDLFWVYYARHLLEDGFKLLGQAAWMGYFALVAAQPIRAYIRGSVRLGAAGQATPTRRDAEDGPATFAAGDGVERAYRARRV